MYVKGFDEPTDSNIVLAWSSLGKGKISINANKEKTLLRIL